MNTNIRNRDYELLLEDCVSLYDELEGSRDYIECLVNDINIALEDIQESLESVDEAMDRCTERLRSISHMETLRNTNFQRTTITCVPEAGAAEIPMKRMSQNRDFPYVP